MVYYTISTNGCQVKMGYEQDYLVFDSDLSFNLHKLTFLGNIASTARSYSGEISTYIK